MNLNAIYGVVGARLLGATAPSVSLPAAWLFRQQAPEEASFPHCVVMVQAPQDLNAIGPKRVAGTATLSIRWTGEDADWSDLQTLCDWTDALLQTQPGAGATAPWTGAIRSSVRESTYDYIETFEGKQYAHQVLSYKLITA